MQTAHCRPLLHLRHHFPGISSSLPSLFSSELTPGPFILLWLGSSPVHSCHLTLSSHKAHWNSQVLTGWVPSCEMIYNKWKPSLSLRRSPHGPVGNAAVVIEETLAIFRICNNSLDSSPVLSKTSLFRCGWWHDIKVQSRKVDATCFAPL